MSKDTKSHKMLTRRKDESSDSDSFVDSDSDSDSFIDDNSENEMNSLEFKKYLSKIFPSKYLNTQVKKKSLNKNNKNNTNRKNKYSILKRKEVSSKKSPQKKYKKKYIVDEDSSTYNSYEDSTYVPESEEENSEEESEEENSEEEESEEEESDEEESEEEESDEDEESNEEKSDEEESDEEETEEEPNEKKKKNVKKSHKKTNKKTNNVNIIFTTSDKYADNNGTDTDESITEYVTEDEDESISSLSDVENASKKYKRQQPIKCKKNKNKNKTDINEQEDITKNVVAHIKPTTSEMDLLNMLTSMQSNTHPNKTVKDCINLCKKQLKIHEKKRMLLEQKQKDKNQRIFTSILKDKNVINDSKYFDSLPITQQIKLIKELREINSIIRIEKPYRISILELDIPYVYKSAAIKKINSIKNMEPGTGEYYKIKHWIDTFMKIPFGKYSSLPIKISDGVDTCHNFMEQSQKTLNDAVYGLNDAKMQIMQVLGQFITNPSAIGNAIAIHGPPGTGKTSLVKEGISKILNRPFAFIPLGGATDSSFLEGHSYTYEGSIHGKIVQILIDNKCMNPVFYFDELDKISNTPRGEEIAGILTHLTDTSQNSMFHDKYFADIDFDLSKCLFIFSYNDESKINPILKDRMYRIETKGYNIKQKLTISIQKNKKNNLNSI